MIILYIIAFIFAIGIIIILHELGHFIVAKKSGILCHEFSIGMGPLLWQKRKGETLISIRAIPIGGYVSMADGTMEQILIKEGDKVGLTLEGDSVKEININPSPEDEICGTVTEIELLGAHGEPLEVTLDLEDGTRKTYPILSDAFIAASAKEKIQITPYNRSFDSKRIPSRMLTISAGVIMNFLLALVIYLALAFIQGVPNVNSSEIGGVSENYPGSFLQEGDIIEKIDDITISSWTDLSDVMNEKANKGITELTLTYSRDGKTQEPKTINTYLALNNFGISNIEIPADAKQYTDSNNNLVGVQVGNLALKYGTSSGNAMEPTKNEPVLTSGDTLLAISLNSKDSMVEVNSWEDVVTQIGHLKDVNYFYYEFYSYENKKVYTSATPVYSYSNTFLDGQGVECIKTYIGITPTYYFSFSGCVAQGFKDFGSNSMIIFKTLRELISPTASVREVGVSDLSGVVGIFGLIKNTVSSGILPYLSLIALLSVNIGIMNFLPIPALDGGRFVFLIYEAITHKKPNKKVEAILNQVVFILLMILFLFVTYNDILRIFK